MKRAVVTGSTKGIGYAIALYLMQKGCEVIMNYSKDDISARQASENLDKLGYKGKYKIIKADLSSIDGLKEFEKHVDLKNEKIDYLILNTAITKRGSLSDITIQDWENVITTNLTVPLFMVKLFKDNIKENGCILFIGAVMGQFPHAMSISYGTSKAAIHYLTKSLVKEFEEKCVRVNCVAPSFVETPWQKNKPEEIRKSIESKIALHRFAKPEEVAHIAYSVLENPYMNGSIVNIDGGYCYK